MVWEEAPAEGLAAAQKLENLVRRRQGADNMNYAGVLHNEGMFLHDLGRFPEAVDKLNAALAIKLETFTHLPFLDEGNSHPHMMDVRGSTR